MLQFDPRTAPASHDVRDQWNERLVARRVGDAHAAEVAHRAAGLLTGVAVLIPDDSRGPALVDRLSQWKPDRLRVEQLVLATEHARDARGGRAEALEDAVSMAASDFVVVPADHSVDLDGLPELLVHMWVEGADVGLMGPTGSQPEVPETEPVLRRRPLFTTPELPELVRADRMADPAPDSAMPAPDTAARVAAWLGLAEAPVAGRVVVLRRWVARWLLAEIGRALDPVEEFADRARVLGLGVVELVGTPAA